MHEKICYPQHKSERGEIGEREGGKGGEGMCWNGNPFKVRTDSVLMYVRPSSYIDTNIHNYILAMGVVVSA